MSDKLKVLFALIFFALGALLPLIGIATMLASALDWIQTSGWVGLAITIGTFIVFFGIGGLLLLRVEDLSWITVSLPFLFSSVYTLIPDLIPLSIDDAAAMTAGAIFSALLAIRKNPAAPRWIFLPLIGAAVYTLLGGILPGPVDELIVDVLALLVTVYSSRRESEVESKIENPISGIRR